MRGIAIVVTVLGAGGAARAGGGGVASATWVDGDAPFAPTTTTSGTPLHWEGSCVFLRVHAAGAADVPGALEPAVAAAAQGWEDATRACGYLRFELEPAEAGEVGYDGVNRIVVREDRWCRPGPPERCYDASATAITTLHFVEDPGSPRDGVIVDADIELNAVDYALATCDGQGGCASDGAGVPSDLQNVLTHELGHVIGLDHTCWAGLPGEAPLDGDGVPVPPCAPASALPAEVTDATMYNFAAPEETLKRTPELDDVDGFCAAYPVAADPASCAPVPGPNPDPDPDPDPDPPGDGGGCSSAGGASGSLAIAVLAVALVACGRRRRRIRAARARCPID